MQVCAALCALHVGCEMIVSLISYKTVTLALCCSVLRGEFLSDFHQFNSSASLLLMKRGGSRRFSSYRLNHLLCIAYESLGRMMISRAALCTGIARLLLMSSGGSRSIKRLDRLRC